MYLHMLKVFIIFAELNQETKGRLKYGGFSQSIVTTMIPKVTRQV